ncbi:uncharacterized protein LOC129601119 isoform X2 [Paramacrobiotus metropolitanus]|uniref:uncharacterized protein LOC129601119 isoform X2 n=1 Tax=Paramacrobiotus metropolitanus TaxID=2943436 RepID=UPI002445D5C6|nr:uncharacterized protein LOC129601119 isoform X2 [Paramacrobiotus metropolitanus]
MPSRRSPLSSSSVSARRRLPAFLAPFLSNRRSAALLAILLQMLMPALSKAEFIDKVECEKDKMLVYINERKVQEEFPGVTVDRYTVYVNNFKDSCKDDTGAISTSGNLMSKRFVVWLNGQCGIDSASDNTMGLHKEWLVYQTTIRLEALNPRPTDGRVLEQRVKCVYSTSHQAVAASNKLIVNDAPGGNFDRQSAVSGAGTVEGSAPSVEDFIELFFANSDPQFTPMTEATIGDTVRIVLRMTTNVAYSTMKPEFCIVSNKPYSNRNEPDFRELILVKDGCSIDSIPPLIPKMVYRAALSTGEPEMYYSKFVMFQMGDFNELHAMCNVRLCITNAEAACDTQSPRGCFESVRRKRSAPYAEAQNGRIVTVSTHGLANANVTAENSDVLTVSGKLIIHNGDSTANAVHQLSQFCFPTITFSVLAAVLAWFFVLAFIATVCLAYLLKREKQRTHYFHTKYAGSDCS